MVYRIYVEKQPELAFEAAACLRELRDLPEVSNLRQLRLLNRYDVEGISEDLFQRCVKLVFSEPQTDRTFFALPQEEDCQALAVEYLPGQFDQRADSAAQCIQLISGHERPLLRTARVYLLYGDLGEAELAAVKNCLINPVECREAELGEYSSLRVLYEEPADVPVLEGFCACSDAELGFYISKYGLAMDNADLLCCRDYFRSEQRDPTLTELRVLDTYWSDHCRHTTFSTTLDEIQIEDADVQAAFARYLQTREELGRSKPINLMDMATGAMRYLKHTGQLKNLDESPEINACTVRVKSMWMVSRSPGCCCLRMKRTTIPRKSSPLAALPPAWVVRFVTRCPAVLMSIRPCA